ncbi:hypothetical protein [Oligoflexus tunisiensis]|uniref:hypothetical protein n=1 Tax=Oligoflexus tunisiensis TaxID=708132 RepID=UPI00114CF356|nr:hypothetical protein [Oligoflexus tunisiensis]
MVANNFDKTFSLEGAANFRTHRLVPVTRQRIEMRPTIGNRLFSTCFIALPAASLAYWEPGWIFALLALPIPILGLVMLLRTQTFIFDQGEGQFRITRIWPSEKDQAIKLRDIEAVQYLTGQADDYAAGQINLCLKNGLRYHVLTHARQKVLRVEAEALAAFLNVPLAV